MVTTVEDLKARFRRIRQGDKKELECRFVEDAVHTSRSADSAVALEAERILNAFDGFSQDRFVRRWMKIHCPEL